MGKDGRTMKKGVIILIAAVVLVLLAAMTCTATVQTGYTGIVTTFGRVEGINGNVDVNIMYRDLLDIDQ